MSGLLFRLQRAGRRAREIFDAHQAGGPPCGACGFAGRPLRRDLLWPSLIEEWTLTPQWADWMNQREGWRCVRCSANLRCGQLASAIVQFVAARHGSTARSLRALVREPIARRLAIAEINLAGNLHRHLARCPGLRHSEYGSRDPQVPSEDLTRLSYADASFDLVITADTLEHVPDIDLALRETYRVLKPGGAHVFSVPVIWDRQTRQRALIRDGELVHLLPPSHHGAAGQNKSDFLVFYEFGADFPNRCTAAGFSLQLLKDDSNPALVTFTAVRPQA